MIINISWANISKYLQTLQNMLTVVFACTVGDIWKIQKGLDVSNKGLRLEVIVSIASIGATHVLL
jgi:hypothetical protein